MRPVRHSFTAGTVHLSLFFPPLPPHDSPRTIAFFSKECQKKDWKSGHKQICPRAKACMAREVKEDLPAFTFPMGIRAGGMRAWLEHQGVHNKGLWRRMCACASTIPPGDLPAQEAQEDDPAGWALPSKFIPSSQDTLPLDPTSSENWGSYYSFRKLPLKSPAAVLLSLPLSIYHGLRTLSLLPTNPSSASTSLSIIVLDPVDLLDTYPLLDELRNAIDPSISLAIHLIGPKIPTALAGQTKMLDASSPFSIHFHPPIPLSDLHTNDTLGSANMVCILSKRLGQNATSSPSSSWSHVISTCLRLDRPLWITETDELAAIDSRDYLQDAIKHHPHMATLPVQLNPWRSPIYQEREEMALPTFDHGFTTGIYVSSESTPSLVK